MWHGGKRRPLNMAARRRAGGAGRPAVILMWAGLHAYVSGCQWSECGSVLTESEGQLTSPCYPSKYGNSASCRWSLRAPPGFVVQISFEDFELEEAPGCIYDRLTVATGGGEVKFCGVTAAGLVLNASGNAVDLDFASDFSIQKRGFRISFRHVAVALRNQKVSLSGSGAPAARVWASVTVPTLHHLTLCLELERSGPPQQVERIFTYGHADGDAALALGADRGRVKMAVGGATCWLDSIVTPADWTSSALGLCLLWASPGGHVGVYFNGKHWAKTCSDSGGRAVRGGGAFRLGGPSGFGGSVYNLRVWDYAMTVPQLDALGCRAAGNVIDWDNGFWDVPPSLAQTDAALSCSVTLPGDGSIHGKCDSTRVVGCPEALFYRLALVVRDRSSTLTPAHVKEALAFWLNETFRNWTRAVSVDLLGVRPQGHSSFLCRALLRHHDVADDRGDVPAQVRDRISSGELPIGAGLEVHADSVHVSPLENCPEDDTVHYRWPKSLPSAAHFLPCFPNKDQSATRSCLIDRHNISSFWSSADFSNCTDIDAIQVSAENAAEVAVRLAAITDNRLSREEVSKVVSKVQQLVNVANINTSLASTVVTIISNVMSSPHSALAPASDRALRAVDRLLDKLQFEGSSVRIGSRRLALGVSAFNASAFNGTSFSAFVPTNSSDPQVGFESEQLNSLAQVTLPPSLLLGADPSTPTRINFLFFSTTGLFQLEQDGRTLISYVVASSVARRSVSKLKDPVEIHISHLAPQSLLSPLCVFWDFSMNGGGGGWNGDGCRVATGSGVNKTVCLCDHLTHFGILMDISGVSPHIDRRNNRILTFITFIGCGVSAIFSAATLLTYAAFQKLRRDYPSKILMNLSASLLLLNVSFLLNGWLSWQRSEALCRAAAALLHYFLLTSFTWMGLESLHMYIALVKVFNTYVRRYILKFCLLGWGESFSRLLGASIGGLRNARPPIGSMGGRTAQLSCARRPSRCAGGIGPGCGSTLIRTAGVRRRTLWRRIGAVVSFDGSDRWLDGYIRLGRGSLDLQSETDDGGAGRRPPHALMALRRARLSLSLPPLSCWIRSAAVFYAACVAYFCLVFLLNAAMFVVVMLQICGRNGKRGKRTLRQEVVRNLRSGVSLTFLLGMTWAFAFFAWGPVSLVFVYLFAIFNSLQGLFIFFFHCALKENVQKQWRRSLCCAGLRLSENSDWSKTATNNTKKASSEQAVQSLSSCSFGSSATYWTSKAKISLPPFSNTEKPNGAAPFSSKAESISSSSSTSSRPSFPSSR